MSGDFSEPDHHGLAGWLDGCEVPDQRGGPAYVVSFGWLPAQLPPPALPPAALPPVTLPPVALSTAALIAAALIPLPRQAPDDQL